MPPQVQPEHLAAYVALTLGFLFIGWLVNKSTRTTGTNLILLGILVVILACGYAIIGHPALMLVTPALTKIGFLLVLGGLACSLLAACPVPQPATKEADHV